METAIEKGGSEIKLLVFKDERRAISLYQKVGFRKVSIPELDKQLAQEAEKSLRRRIIFAKKIKPS